MPNTQNKGVQKTISRAASAGKDAAVQEAQIIFSSVWQKLEQEFGRENLRFPKEIILLGGAPGSGKGTHTEFILKARGLTSEPLVVSALLSTPEAQKIKNAGGMVGDREVVGILFRKLLEPQYAHGVILDGFPRTKVQVECLKLLVEHMEALRHEYHATPLGVHFRKPSMHIMVLFVDEKTSVDRQLKRGRDILAHNEEVRRTGVGELQEERPTDYDVPLAVHRYRVFKEQTWDALQSLKETFHYHLVNAQGDIESVQKNILDELQYQSTLELDPKTYDIVRVVPLASDIVVHARQELVTRLDGYALENTELFSTVVDFVNKKIMPIVLRHAISGRALVNTEEPLLNDPLALVMLIDIFSERGYNATVDLHRIQIPETVDLKTGKIECRTKKVYRIQVLFPGSKIRRG